MKGSKIVKTTSEIDRITCGMCKTRVNKIVCKQFSFKKVSSFHNKGITEIISEESIKEEYLIYC